MSVLRRIVGVTKRQATRYCTPEFGGKDQKGRPEKSRLDDVAEEFLKLGLTRYRRRTFLQEIEIR